MARRRSRCRRGVVVGVAASELPLVSDERHAMLLRMVYRD